jgi:preprotein translocase subunit SecY
VRPGERTAKYIDEVLLRITVVGAMDLATYAAVKGFG